MASSTRNLTIKHGSETKEVQVQNLNQKMTIKGKEYSVFVYFTNAKGELVDAKGTLSEPTAQRVAELAKLLQEEVIRENNIENIGTATIRLDKDGLQYSGTAHKLDFNLADAARDEFKTLCSDYKEDTIKASAVWNEIAKLLAPEEDSRLHLTPHIALVDIALRDFKEAFESKDFVKAKKLVDENEQLKNFLAEAIYHHEMELNLSDVAENFGEAKLYEFLNNDSPSEEFIEFIKEAIRKAENKIRA